MTRRILSLVIVLLAASTGCRRDASLAPARSSGYVEATEVRIASQVPGRVEHVNVVEGARVTQGAVVATLSTTETELALTHARADRAQADAQLRLLRAGPRPEDVAQAEAQVNAAEADRRAAQADLDGAAADEARFDQLLRTRAGSQKQKDDATARRAQAEARVKGAADRTSAASAALARIRAGARAEEIDAAQAHVGAADAEIATLEHDRAEATIVAPAAGIVTSRLIEPGELAARGAPLVVVVDLDHAWINVYVEEALVPTLRLDAPATVVTDAGSRVTGRIAFISPDAEFTPRNVQTSAERAKLVYRVKVTVDNRDGALKPGMPVEVEWRAGTAAP